MSFVHFDEILELCCEEVDRKSWRSMDGKQSRQAEMEGEVWNEKVQPALGKRKRLIVSSKSPSKVMTFSS